MLKIYFILVIVFLSAFASSSKTCKACHTEIYQEYRSSIHANASIFKDPIFNAIWSRHPLHKKGNFKCAKCHIPSDHAYFKSGKLEKNDSEMNEPISCQTCHQIKAVTHGEKANKNHYLKKDRYFYAADEKNRGKIEKFSHTWGFFGIFAKSKGSPYHAIDYTNELYYNGGVCLGCHSHKESDNGFKVCSLEVKESKDSKETCITCHQPKTQGSFVNLKDSKTHRSHAISLREDSYKQLGKYIDLNITNKEDSIQISIKNHANHALFVHPIREGELRVEINGKEIQRVKLHRIIGKDGKPSAPWLANSVIKDTTLKAFEKRDITVEHTLQKGDRVEAILGYYLIRPKVAKKLNITDERLTKFRILKRIFKSF